MKFQLDYEDTEFISSPQDEAQRRLRDALGSVGDHVLGVELDLERVEGFDGRGGVRCRLRAATDGFGSFAVERTRRDALAAVVYCGQLLRQCLVRRGVAVAPTPPCAPALAAV